MKDKISISDEDGKVPITDVGIFDKMTNDEALAIFEEDENDTPAIDKVVDKFAKGGPGSGQKGHTTQKQKEVAKAKEAIKKGKEALKQAYSEMDSVGTNRIKATQLNNRIAQAQKVIDAGKKVLKKNPISKTPAIDELITKGGPGSGIKGHTTQRFDDREKWIKSLSKDEENAVSSWMRNGYEWLRNEDKSGEDSEELNNLKSAIETAPLYHQSISKGIRADIKIKVGETIEMSALNSFSTNVAVAKGFAVETPGGKALPVSQKFTILKIDNHNGGSQLPMKSIAGTYETEVVMEKGRKFEVVSIEKQIIKRPSLGRGKPPRQYQGKVLILKEVST